MAAGSPAPRALAASIGPATTAGRAGGGTVTGTGGCATDGFRGVGGRPAPTTEPGSDRPGDGVGALGATCGPVPDDDGGCAAGDETGEGEWLGAGAGDRTVIVPEAYDST